MKMRWSSIVALSLVLSIAPAFGISGTVPAGSNAEDLVDDIVAPWSGVLGCLKELCGTPCDIRFFATSGTCLNVQTRLRVSINTMNGELSVPYNWEVVPSCNGTGPNIDIAFNACPGSSGASGACGSLVTLTPGQAMSFGEVDVVAVSLFSRLGFIAVPTMPRWGPAVLGAALVGAALLFIVRRTR